MIQQFAPRHLQEIIQLGNPIAHIHRLAAAGLQFAEVEIHGDNQVQIPDFLQAEIVLRHDHIPLARTAADPRGQSHVRLRGVRAGMDDFRRCVAVRAPVHLVLHRGEKLLRRLHARIVINARRVNLQHLPPEGLLRRPDVPDAREQLVEVIAAPRLLEPFIIHRESLDDVFPQPLRGPDAKLRAAMRLHPVAHRDDDIEIVVFHRAGHLPASLLSNY